MSKLNAIRVLIADDYVVVREGLAAMIDYESDMRVIAEAGDGQEAVDLFAHHRPDITLMDLRMPRMQGVEAIEAIRGQFPSARIIVLTTYSHEEDIYRAQCAGAHAYLLKDALPEDLLASIRAVNAGHRYILTLQHRDPATGAIAPGY